MEIVSTLTVVQRALFLMELEQFKGVSSDGLASLAAKMTEMRYEAGEKIAREDEPEDRLFVVIEGEVLHLRNDVVVRQATSGMAFGVFGLLGIEDPDPEVLLAEKPTHAMALSREDFLEAVFDFPAFATGIIRGLGNALMSYAKRIEALEQELAALRKGSQT